MSAIIAWGISQIAKTIIYWIENRKFDLGRLFGDGGMPSGHSATVSALATACGIEYGLGSFQFAISGILAVIVMHDASGVRLESGKQAKAINEIIALLRKDIFETKVKDLLSPSANFQKLKELLGHTPVQVCTGMLLGVIVTFLMYQI